MAAPRWITCALLAALLVVWPGGTCPAREEAAPRKAPAPLTLRVATYNVWLIPLIAKDNGSRLRRLPAALRALDLDVVCLQEVWTGSDQVRIARALKKPFPHAYRGGGGLLVLSKYPIVEKAFVAFPHYKGLSIGERLARKGLVDVVIKTPAGLVRVVTSHLALAFGPDNPRSKQLRFLLKRLDGRRKIPVILAADLNTWPVEKGALAPDYRLLLAGGFVDAKAPRKDDSGRFDPGAPTRVGWPRPAKKPTTGWYPDHVLFRSGRTGRLALKSFRFALDEQSTALSDHNLLRAEIRIEPVVPSRAKPR